MNKFQEPDLRDARGKWEAATNRQQRKLTLAYDRWGVEVRKLLGDAVNKGMPHSALEAIVNSKMQELEDKMVKILDEGVDKAARLSVGKELANSPDVLSQNRRMKISNLERVRNGMIPRTRETISRALTRESWDRVGLKKAFTPMRSGVAQYAGGYWAAIFETQKTSFKGKPMKVRWVLDPAAMHCMASAGMYGCVELAGVYDDWDALPTVPAGDVTCAGNCRCHLEVFRDGAWRRGLS